MSQRNCTEHTFQTHDGVSLFYRHWASVGTRRGAIVMFHRGHEHSARMAHLVDELDMPDYDFFAWDARGHGQSPGERGYAPSFGTSVRDVQTFVDHISTTHGVSPADMAILAQSVGAVLASTWAHDYAPQIRCLVLASPAFKIKLYVPFARAGLQLMQWLKGNFYVKSYVKAKFLTHDVARQQSYDSDPLIARAISVNILLDLYRYAKRVVADAQAITIPTQLLISGADWVVHHHPQHQFFYNLGAQIKERVVLDGFFHDTLGEANRGPVMTRIREFIQRQFELPLQRPDLKKADTTGETFNEAMRLSEPLSLFSARGLFWAAARLNMKIGGLISKGIKLGHQTGFDSGSTLDYVYRNQPQGLGPLGRLSDYFYLNSIGWRGIRQRKIHLMEILCKAVDLTHAEGRSCRVMDIAAGHGRYVLEALSAYKTQAESILLRDYSDINVRDGQKLIEEKRLEKTARFEKADAFNQEAIATVSPRPTIGIVSGLYELFTSNNLVSRSLAGLAEAIEPGGYLIYTCQPWHPQLELIARALTSHRGGQAWIMRRRTQEEMDQLVAAAGFEKIDQRIDEWGIFTVALARRKA